MKAGKTAKKKARILQEVCGFGYEACLRIVLGDLNPDPLKEGCKVQAGLRLADAHPTYLTIKRPCSCDVCMP